MLSLSTLTDELVAMPETDDELVAAVNLSTAWHNYFIGATVLGVPAIPAVLTPARLAMQSVLLADPPKPGISTPGAGAVVFTAALAAYWGTVSGLAAATWVLVPPLASVVPPPGLAAIQGLLVPIFVTNTAGSLSKPDACALIAACLHVTVGLTGLAVNTAGPPVSFPIL